MNKNMTATILALICIALNIYVMWKGQTATGMTAKQQARIKVVAWVFLFLAFIAMTFGEQLGLQG